MSQPTANDLQFAWAQGALAQFDTRATLLSVGEHSPYNDALLRWAWRKGAAHESLLDSAQMWRRRLNANGLSAAAGPRRC